MTPSAFARLTVEIDGHSAVKYVRVRDRIHSDGCRYSADEERLQTAVEVARQARHALRDLVDVLYP